MRTASRDPITSIRFHAVIPKFAENGDYIGTEVKGVEFKLGLGPCKETVEYLGAAEHIG